MCLVISKFTVHLLREKTLLVSIKYVMLVKVVFAGVQVNFTISSCASAAVMFCYLRVQLLRTCLRKTWSLLIGLFRSLHH